jgi:hypothetical protein
MIEQKWIDVADRLPEAYEQVIVFDPPVRVMAQYVGHIKPLTPWNMMDGRYLTNEQIVLWAEIPEHPYGKQGKQ